MVRSTWRQCGQKQGPAHPRGCQGDARASWYPWPGSQGARAEAWEGNTGQSLEEGGWERAKGWCE